MSFDPVTTFAIYMTAFLGVLTFCAIVADLWLAHDERKRRDQARATARAKRTRERETSRLEWH
jgi:hypothetical protein